MITGKKLNFSFLKKIAAGNFLLFSFLLNGNPVFAQDFSDSEPNSSYSYLESVFLDSETAFPPLEPIFESSYFYDDGDNETEEGAENLTSKEIIEYGLRFSLCEEDSSEWYDSLECYEKLEKMVKSSKILRLKPLERAEEILFILYDNCLSFYKERQTKIDVLFSAGTYNCVSSSVVYLALCRAAGLSVNGVRTPDHAFCVLHEGGKTYDIETTNPYGVNPGDKKVINQTENATKYAVIPKKYYANRREVDDRTLVALVGANMASDFVEKNEYDNSVPMTLTRWLFVRNSGKTSANEGRNDFDIASVNYTNGLERNGQFSESALWLLKIRKKWGNSEKLQLAMNQSFQNSISTFCTNEDFESAQKFFDGFKEYVTGGKLEAAEEGIFLGEIQLLLKEVDNKRKSGKNLTNKDPYDDAFRILAWAEKKPLASRKSCKDMINQWKEYYWISKINSLMQEKDFLAALNSSYKAFEEMPGNKKIINAKSVCVKNYEASVHNEFARLMNSKKTSEATKVLNEGLKNLPQSQVFQSDKKILQKR